MNKNELDELEKNEELALEERRAEIASIKDLITHLNCQKSDLEDGDDKSNYDDMLNNVTPIIKIGNCEYTASEVWKAVDPIAYDCGYDDYVSSEISDIEDELDVLENDLGNLMEEKSI
jgi:DNA repair ATPase RecN